MKKRNLIFSFLAFCGLLFGSCTYDIMEEIEVNEPVGPISFAEQVEPIFSDAGCTGCHPNVSSPDLTSGNAYESIMSGNLVDLNNPENSTIYTEPAPGGGHSGTYSPQEAVIILNWIIEGAENN